MASSDEEAGPDVPLRRAGAQRERIMRTTSAEDDPRRLLAYVMHPDESVDLDGVLARELGQLGRYQLRTMLLLALPLLVSGFLTDYVFATAAIPHRCRVPECGEESSLEPFEPEWIAHAVPQTSSGLASCSRYQALANGTADHCPATLFVQNITTACDGFVYARDNSIVHAFDLGCQNWLRVLPGTMNSVGSLLTQLLTGYVSDRFGRRTALVLASLNLSVVGVIRAFSVNYGMYTALQLLNSMLGGGVFSSAYVLITEMVGPKYRVMTSSLATVVFSLSQLVMATTAWLVQSWRVFLLVLYIPPFFFISYYWILPESVRWLLSVKKYEQAKETLLKIAKVNKTSISENSIQALTNPQSSKSQEVQPNLFKTVIKSPVLLRRVCTTPVWWISGTFIFFGLSINSTSLSDTVYLNYILTCAIEIPGFFLPMLILDRIGRRATLSGGYFFSSACILAFLFIPNGLWGARLAAFLLGKLGAAVVMNSLYLYTSELYPTECRQRLLSLSSMIGRIGSISAPLTPALGAYWHGIPSLLFITMGVLAGLLVLTQPETLGCKLPDTIADAEALGRPPADK